MKSQKRILLGLFLVFKIHNYKIIREKHTAYGEGKHKIRKVSYHSFYMLMKINNLFERNL